MNNDFLSFIQNKDNRKPYLGGWLLFRYREIIGAQGLGVGGIRYGDGVLQLDISGGGSYLEDIVSRGYGPLAEAVIGTLQRVVMT